LVGAVSPSGGDFTEPVTTHTMRFIKTFWALDAKLAYSRHYPSINWMNSYSGYLSDVAKWWSENVSEEWLSIRGEAYAVLQREDTLKEIVRLLGPEALPDEEKLILEVARMIKIGLLQQNSFDEVDTYCSPEKQYKLLKLLVDFYNRGQQALKEGAALADIRAMSVVSLMLKARMDVKDDEMSKLDQLDVDMQEQFKSITGVKVQN
jgi:V/A-type H+-transporting ATPase subunit A